MMLEISGVFMEEMKNPQSAFSEILADPENTLGAGDTAEALPRRLHRYAKAKDRALVMAKFTKENSHVKEFRELSQCGCYLQFHHYYTVDKVRLAAARTCKMSLLCPFCAIHRGAKMLRAYMQKLEFITAENPHLKPYFVTFTVKNGEHLKERFNHLQSSVQKLHKKRQGTRQRSEMKKCQGAVWTYEVTNKGNGWHPHVHAIWLCSSPPSKEALQQEWHDITGDSYILDIRDMSQNSEGSYIEAFLEVFKYAVKFSDLKPEDNFHAYQILSRRRLVGSLGLFYGVQIPEKEGDDIEPEFDDLPYIELLYRYAEGVGYSFVSSTHRCSKNGRTGTDPAAEVLTLEKTRFEELRRSYRESYLEEKLYHLQT